MVCWPRSATGASHEDRDCLALILQGKRLGFTLTEIREMLATRARGDCTENLPINRTKCVEQIKMMERQRRDIDRALAELRSFTPTYLLYRMSGLPAHPI